MGAPSLNAAQQGAGQVSADNLNTYTQSCDTVSDLQSFIGLPGMQVYLRGISAVDDGGNGFFYWNESGSANDLIDNISPFSASSGCWTRLTKSDNTSIPVTVTGANVLALTPLADTTPILAYANNQTFTGVATSNSTGLVTAYVVNADGVPLATIPVYLGTGSQAGSGNIASGAFMVLAYVSSLNSGAGGFSLINQPSASGSFAPISNPNFSGTAELNAHPIITQVNIQTFTTTGTYTPTVGTVYVIAEVGGGGGGGGGIGSANLCLAGGGGGGGGYSRGVFNAASIGASVAVTIGVGGTAGSNSGGNGGGGGTSSFGSLITGVGGGSGGGGVNGGDGHGSAGLGGTTGTGGLINIAGNPGAPGYPGASNQPLSGYGGNSIYGGGGSGVFVAAAAASAGNSSTGYGSGGSGACSGSASSGQIGGAGSPGVIVITEYISA